MCQWIQISSKEGFIYQSIELSKKLNNKEWNNNITSVGEIKAMENKKDNDIRCLGLILIKKSAIYLTILSSIGVSFFASSLMFTFPVLRYNMTHIYQDDILIYSYTILLFISNLIASSICICIFSYTLSKVRTFRKSLK